MILKKAANFCFYIFLNLFTRVSCYYNVSMSPFVFITLVRARNRVLLRDAKLGKGVVFDHGCTLYYGAELFGNVTLGRYTSISGPSTRICAEVNRVIIGSFCSIASNVIIQEFYHNYNRTTTYNIHSHILGVTEKNQLISKGDIIIEDDVWIGSNSTILSGVRIGRGSIIGAGSVVTKDVERYTIVGGNPAKQIRKRFSSETIQMLEESKWWEWSVEQMKANPAFFSAERG